MLRRTATDADGDTHVIAEEYAVMDRAGRVQVPRDYREALALTRRVRLALEADHVAIRPDRGRRDDRRAAAARGTRRPAAASAPARPPCTRCATSRSTSRRAPWSPSSAGPGSGKTTLLNVIGGLDRPDAGTVIVDGTDVTALDEDGLSRLRREKVSYVFQTFGLIPVLSAAENVGAPLRLARVAGRRARAPRAAAARPGRPADHAEQRPAELSGGQQQRVAIARALAASPRLLIADEPTGQLDAETGLSVMALLRGVVESEGVTALVSTHDPVMMALADRVIRIATASSPMPERRGFPVGPVVRRAAAQWQLLAAVLVVIVLSGALVGIGVLLVGPGRQAALGAAAASVDGTGTTSAASRADLVVVTARTDGASDDDPPGARAVVDDLLPALRQALSPLDATESISVSTPPALLPGAPARLAYLLDADTVQQHATVVAGRWPAPGVGATGGPTEVVLPSATAQLLGLAVGDRLSLGPTPLTVVGLVEHDASGAWDRDRLRGVGADVDSGWLPVYGPFLVAPGTVLAADTPVGLVSIEADADLTAHTDALGAAAARVAALGGTLDGRRR